MTNGNFRRTLVGAAVVAALTVLATPAGAAPYRGVFDPADFEGEYIIDVDPDCLLTSGWHANIGLCAATLTSAIADVASSAPEPTFTGQLTFAPPAISSSSVLFGIYVYGGAIQSFDTDLIPAVGASPATTDNWWIQFTSGHACYGGPCYGGFPGIDIAGAPTFNPDLNGVYLYGAPVGFPPGSPIDRASYIGPAQAVPEPGTLALALGALGGGWLARRRRKQKEANSS